MRGVIVAVAALLLACGPLKVLPAAEGGPPPKTPTAPPRAPTKGETVLAHEPVPFGEKMILPPEPEPPPDAGGLRELGVTTAETSRPDAPSVPQAGDLVALAPPAPPGEGASPAERGAYLYARHCATCHGTAADGDGPSASALLYPPADLTRIAERRGGVFVASDIAAHLDGRVAHPSHGPADAPLWGAALEGPGLAELLEHLEKVQIPEPDSEAAKAPPAGS